MSAQSENGFERTIGFNAKDDHGTDHSTIAGTSGKRGDCH